MLLLTSPTDQLQVHTNNAAAVDIHASWVDITPSTGVIAPGRLNTAVTLPGIANVAGSPPASTQRNVKALHIFNKDASATTVAAIVLVDGTGTYPIFTLSMTPGTMIEVTDMGGIRVFSP